MRGVPSGARPGVGKRLGNCLNVTVYEIGNGFIGVAAYLWPRVTEALHRAQPVTNIRDPPPSRFPGMLLYSGYS